MAPGGDEDADMPEIGDGDVVSELLTSNVDVRVEAEKSKRPKKRKRQPDSPKLSKKVMAICAVPGCKSRFLLSVGVKLSSFQVLLSFSKLNTHSVERNTFGVVDTLFHILVL